MDPPTIEESEVVAADIEASNGIVHLIDSVLIPPPTITDLAIQTPDLSTLVDLVVLADLADTLAGEGPFTVFAPTNDAFAALPSDLVESLTDPDNVDDLTNVLLYHGTCAW